MKLTRLRLLGFKSFVEPTDFTIEPGLTGVVGPNGCGKSNLVEALRWVMGESSHKSMRASSMDDVIFSGSNTRQARQAIRYRTVSSQVRKAEATLYHLRWTAANNEVTEADRAKDLCVRTVAGRVEAEAEASKRQALAAAALPELREAEARAGAALHRLNVALQDLDREEARAKDRIAELDLRLVQFAADTRREQRLGADAAQAIARLATEEETPPAEGGARRRRPRE